MAAPPMNLQKHLMVLVLLIYANMTSSMDDVTAIKVAAISAYPTFHLYRCLSSYYVDKSDVSDLSENNNASVDSTQYRIIQSMILSMHIHGKPVKVKMSHDIVSTSTIPDRNNHYICISQSKLERIKRSIERISSSYGQDIGTYYAAHEAAHVKNNDGAPAQSLGQAAFALLAGIATQYGIERIAQQPTKKATTLCVLPIALSAGIAAIHLHRYWREYRADRDAFSHIPCGAIQSRIVYSTMLHVADSQTCSRPLLQRVKFHLTDEHPYFTTVAALGNAIIKTRFGENETINIDACYNYLHANFKFTPVSR